MGTMANIPATVTDCGVLAIGLEIAVVHVALLTKLTRNQSTQSIVNV